MTRDITKLELQYAHVHHAPDISCECRVQSRNEGTLLHTTTFPFYYCTLISHSAPENIPFSRRRSITRARPVRQGRSKSRPKGGKHDVQNHWKLSLEWGAKIGRKQWLICKGCVHCLPCSLHVCWGPAKNQGQIRVRHHLIRARSFLKL